MNSGIPVLAIYTYQCLFGVFQGFLFPGDFRVRSRRKPREKEPLRLRDLKGPKLRAVLEAREVLEDAHLLSAQRTGEATPGKGAWTKSGTPKSRVVTLEFQ